MGVRGGRVSQQRRGRPGGDGSSRSRTAEPKKLRYRLLHTAARITRGMATNRRRLALAPRNPHRPPTTRGSRSTRPARRALGMPPSESGRTILGTETDPAQPALTGTRRLKYLTPEGMKGSPQPRWCPSK
ncbi:hypothetical protein KNE206_66520 [Kitasatospora sp. NE20-6]